MKPVGLIITGFILLQVGIFQPVAFSQTKEIDSLKIALSTVKDDAGRIKILNKLSYELYVNNFNDLSLQYARQQLELAKKNGYPEEEAYALKNIGHNYRDANKLEEATRYYTLVGDIGRKLNNKKLLGLSYSSIGGVKSYAANFTEAARYWDTALTYYRQTGDRKAIAGVIGSLGTNYYDQANYPEAIRYLYTALDYWEEVNDEVRMADCYYYIGDIIVEQKNYDDALRFYGKAVAVNMKLADESSTPASFQGLAALSLTKIGEICLLKNNPDSALVKFNDALQKLDNCMFSWALMGGKGKCYVGIGKVYELKGDKDLSNGNDKGMKVNFSLAYENYKNALDANKKEGYGKIGFENDNPKIYRLLGNVCMKMGRQEEAGKWFQNALDTSVEKKARVQIRDSYLSLSGFYEHTGNTGKAFGCYKKYIAYRDSIVNEESIRKSESYQLKNEFSKREDSLNQKQFITETKLNAERKQKYLYLAGFGLLALLAFFVLLNYHNQRKLNRLAKENFEKEKAALQLQALRTQLNPHFIFNCISCIDGLIQANEKYSATNYLNKFAKLMRNILDVSKENTVRFSNDIETLKLYLDLEQLRNEDKYTVRLTIDEELVNCDYVVPPMIIQPFVENAIQHGLKNRPGKNGLLSIDIRRVDDYLQYVISDNGIGRTATEKSRNSSRRSFGVDISMDRIRLFNAEENPSVNIEDIYENETALGTTVTVKLKIR